MLPPRGTYDSEYASPANLTNRANSQPDVGWDEYYHKTFCKLASRFDRAPTYSPLPDEDSEDNGDSRRVSRIDFNRSSRRDRGRLSTNDISPLQFLPTEVSLDPFCPRVLCRLTRLQIVQDIAVRLDSDVDLSAMIKTSPTWYSILHPDGSNCIWRQHFLARYDHPLVESNLEFPFAYKVRQLVLKAFDGVAIGNSLKQRSGHQLDVVKDMVLGNVAHRVSILVY